MAQILRNDAIREIYACVKNPIYFIETYCKIQHAVKGVIPFKLYKYQQEALKLILGNRRSIINKPRQMGFTTLLAAFCAWLIIFHNNKTVLVLSKDAEAAKTLIDRVKFVLVHLPDWMYLAEVTTKRKHMIALSNGSWIKSMARTTGAGRSEAVSLLIFDEAAHIADMDEIWGAAGPTTATGGKIIALSTPKGIGNWFYKFYTDAEQELNGWKNFRVDWWDNPDYAQGVELDPKVPGGKTSPWFRDTTAGWSETKIRQEFLTSFIETGDNFFELNTLQKCEKTSLDAKVLRKFKSKITMDNNCWIWREPGPNNKYIISADVGMGVGEDYSAAQVLELVNCEQVAEYKGKLLPDAFAEFLIELGTTYNNAYIIVENNSFGMATALALRALDYPNIVYIEKKSGRLIDKWYAETKNILPGFTIDSGIRPAILSKLKEYLENDYLKIYSSRFIAEMRTFSVINGKPQAVKGHHDDLIMATALGIWVRDVCPEFGAGVMNEEAYLKMYDSIIVNRNSMEDLPGFERSEVNRQARKNKEFAEQQKTFKIGNNVVIDLSFLYK